MSDTNIQTGLSDADVRSRVLRGQLNGRFDSAAKSVGSIIRSNTLTIFNLFNICLLALVLLTGQYRNTLFFLAIMGNTGVGIFQELRARSIIEKMSLMGKSPVYTLRNGAVSPLEREDIVLDDIFLLKKGDQIPVDSIIISEDKIEVDESMLTGEADSVVKHKGDKLFAGSIVLLGQTKARVTAVGKDIYISRLSAAAKTIKIKKSKLQREINLIIKIMICSLAVVGPILFIRQLAYVRPMYYMEWQDVLLRSLSAVIGMTPQGLVLMTSVGLTAGVLSLSQHRVLTQELPAIETLARVDVLCLDKTGTLTEGTLKVAETIYFGKDIDLIKNALSALSLADEEQNTTARALFEAFPQNPCWKIASKIPFSSASKWQAAEFADNGVWALGAPEIILPADDNSALTYCAGAAEQGFRVLALARGKTPLICGELPDEMETMAAILMTDHVRENAAEILKYFTDQNVDIRIISGDNPSTVTHICETAGIFDLCVDAQALPTEPLPLREAIRGKKMFGRVTPEQKKQIIEALQADGHVVAMTGDGINDILALKQSDCAIAMAAGSEAAKSVAQFVLLDSDFAVLPLVVEQGRQVINNMNRVASLFLIKTTWSLLMALALSVLLFPYPFTPFQMQFVDFIAIGLPSFLLLMEPNYEIIRGDFLKKMIIASLPGAVSVFGLITATLLRTRSSLIGFPFDDVAPWLTTNFIVITLGIHLWSMILNCFPMTWFRVSVIILVLAGSVAFFLIPPLMRIFTFASAQRLSHTLLTLLAGMALTLIIRLILQRIFRE